MVALSHEDWWITSNEFFQILIEARGIEVEAQFFLV